MTRLHDSYLIERRCPFTGLPMFTRRRAPWWRRWWMAACRVWVSSQKASL